MSWRDAFERLTQERGRKDSASAMQLAIVTWWSTSLQKDIDRRVLASASM